MGGHNFRKGACSLAREQYVGCCKRRGWCKKQNAARTSDSMISTAGPVLRVWLGN
jgi:hypothetical protein